MVGCVEGIVLLGPIDAAGRIATFVNGVEAWTEIVLQQKHIRTRSEVDVGFILQNIHETRPKAWSGIDFLLGCCMFGGTLAQ